MVYRAGKLPKELPPWFAQMDEDKDGQVGLYEWKKAGRPVNEFLAMDLNGDGFVTVEEALRYTKIQSKNIASAAPTSGFGGAPELAAPVLAAPGFGGPPGMGGPPRMGGPPSFGGPPGMGGPPSMGGPPGGAPGPGSNPRWRRRQQQ